MLQEKNHRFIANIPAEPIWLLGDPVRIEQVLMNLLVNAVKYTSPGGEITINVKIEEGTLIISVIDTGIGIASDHLSQIFEPFLQLHKDASGQNSGLGIGLGLSKKLVELHGGNITAKSQGPGLGSKFTVTIPIPQNIQLPLGIESDKIQNSNLKKYKILVVDDNVPAAEGLGELLRYGGHTVELAHDGPATLEKIKSFYADIIVLDIGLPEISGYEVARKIRELINRQITLIALTGYGQDSDKARAIKAGFNYHLTKPISISDIENILANL